MTNKEKNALRIAELLGYNEWRLNNIQEVIFNRYTAYDFLMPIVFECNGTNDFYYYRINLNEDNDDYVSIRMFCNSQDTNQMVGLYDYDPEDESDFIEAIQLACIKYLEIKNEMENQYKCAMVRKTY